MELMGLFLFTQLYRLNRAVHLFSAIHANISGAGALFSARSTIFSGACTIFSAAHLFSAIHANISGADALFSARSTIFSGTRGIFSAPLYSAQGGLRRN